ncbi:hypothetical protein CHS0354_021042 [Potamilus streckersoni]|uniref:Uncharacterized protein n=1 Tax=Potamilus streckersoni TaxID=2493646 RepID=A0AAE0VUQ5_9BIVA|nr:hypothetical protein CHS0354_021042 [Potamilus streckersoni]
MEEQNAVIGSGGVAYYLPLDSGVADKISTPPARLTRKSIPKMDLFTTEEKVLMAEIIRKEQLKKKGNQARIAEERRARVEQRRRELELAEFEIRVLAEADKEEESKVLEKETTDMQEILEDRKRRLEELARKTKLKVVTSRGKVIGAD